MKNPSQEDLLGYVLGALDANQHSELQKKIDEDVQLDEQLLEIKARLLPLELLHEPSGCRPGLARRTCEMVASLPPVADPDLIPVSRMTDSQGREPLFRQMSWSVPDFLVAAATVGILASLLFPVLSFSKYRTQIADCGNNLRSVGFALATYSEIHDGQLVEIPATGPLAFAGSFGPILKDAQLIESDNWFSCAATNRDAPLFIPSCDQVRQCSDMELSALQRCASGDYGYSFGHVENGRYFAPSNNGCSNRIICADKPSLRSIGGPSDNHCGRGQNCLFADQHVEFVVGNARGEDSIYVNAYNVVGPGVGSHDSVIGASHLSPRAGVFDVK